MIRLIVFAVLVAAAAAYWVDSRAFDFSNAVLEFDDGSTAATIKEHGNFEYGIRNCS